MFRKILIANRGEIALRLARACRDLGIEPVAVYSEADREALHVLRAAEAVGLGPAAPRESYLSIPRVIAAARQTGAEALHPGYGFLSENPELPAACAQAGIVFIGPPAAAMERLGSKTAARALAQRCGVPVVPGTLAGLRSAEEARALAARFGYPVMLKAAAGGGGKGMRLVERAEDLAPALELAAGEALAAFGDGTVYLEKAVLRPRHVEIQILADQRGHCIHLGERECSVQRRHQKVIEESPALRLPPGLRDRMGAAAVAVCQAAGYVNAGTVEFLLDGDDQFYFLEVNTRLQVEHPVTEWVTGVDLVQRQIAIAAGEPLDFRQQDIAWRGHAIECRLYAEDPAQNFFPCPGRITQLVTPAGPGLREDSGIYAGWNVPLEYDPLLSKLIAWGENRPQALARMRRALGEYHIGGIRTNLPLFRRILDDPEFAAGHVDTGYLARLLAAPPLAPAPEWGRAAALA
ncbi:MAG: acetyl-CoA carboxylase biotin carboxylase subunit, partial [Terriglobales bacterium]